MKEKVLRKELISDGFVVNDKGLLNKTIDDIEISIGIDSGVFGNIFLVNIYYNFKKELPFEESLLESIWKQSEIVMDASGTGLIIGALDTRWICGVIQQKQFLKDMSYERLKVYCKQFVAAIKPIIEEHDL